MPRWWWSLKKRVVRLSPVPRRAERLGAAWVLDPSDWLDMRLIIGQPFEDAQRERFARLLSERRPETLYDIGANIGLYAILMALRFADLKVEAFEPVGTTRARLALHVALNALEGRVRVHPHALSDREGEAEIAIDPNSSGLSTLSAAAPEARRRAFRAMERVPVARLDDLVRAPGRVLAFKIDVEGHEVETLAGMSRLLGECDGVMMVEMRARNAHAVRAALGAAGWRQIDQIDEEAYFAKP